MSPLRLLTFSTLFPNAGQPNHGVFVENRLRHLVATGEASSTVLAPVPYFPFRDERFGPWSRYALAERLERRHGLDIHHPRYLSIPRVGMTIAPALLTRASLPAARRLIAGGARFDLIDAHYLYPDGVAAIALGRALGLPVVITARGSDVTQLPDFPTPRRMILEATRQAAGLVTVSAGLKDALVALGVPADRVTVLRNGVDTAVFTPHDPQAAKVRLGLSGPVMVSVGALIERKGHHLTIAALLDLPGWTLLIAGDGPQRQALTTLAATLGVSDRVRLLGPVPHPELPALYSAADLSVLASAREGWANVLLESMACGTPVVASNIPGNPEVVRERAAGLIVEVNTPAGIVAGVRALAADPPARETTRAYAERFSWDETSAGQLHLFHAILAARAVAAA